MSERSADDDSRLVTRLRQFADRPLRQFDPERAALAVTKPDKRRSILVALATAVGVAVIVSFTVFLTNSLSLPTALPGQGPAVSNPSSPSLPAGLTREEAVTEARAAAPHRAEAPVYYAVAGRFGDLLEPEVAYRISPAPPADRWVWIINLASGPEGGLEGSMVVIDFFDGRLYDVIDWSG